MTNIFILISAFGNCKQFKFKNFCPQLLLRHANQGKPVEKFEKKCSYDFINFFE